MQYIVIRMHSDESMTKSIEGLFLERNQYVVVLISALHNIFNLLSLIVDAVTIIPLPCFLHWQLFLSPT